MFGEYHPEVIPVATAFFGEFLGTAFLAFVIFALTDKRRADPLPTWLIPPAIGVTLTLLISLFAPLSMAGFNPARDFAPRLFSVLAG
jgi:glycerol uptake facilitator-like aquaporin